MDTEHRSIGDDVDSLVGHKGETSPHHHLMEGCQDFLKWVGYFGWCEYISAALLREDVDAVDPPAYCVV